MSRLTVSGCGEVGVGELLVVEGESGGEHSLSVWGDSVEALVWDFGDQSVTAEFRDESGDACAAAVRFGLIGGWSRVEAGDEVVVAEPGDVVTSCEDGLEQLAVGWS